MKIVFFNNAVFDECNLGRSKFKNSTIQNNDFTNCNFKRAVFDFTHIKTTEHLEKTISMNLFNSDLTCARFSFPEYVSNKDNNTTLDVSKILKGTPLIDSMFIHEFHKPPQIIIFDTSDEDNHLEIDRFKMPVNPKRAYEWADRNGEKCRRFVESGEWIPNIEDHESKSQEQKEESIWDRLKKIDV